MAREYNNRIIMKMKERAVFMKPKYQCAASVFCRIAALFLCWGMIILPAQAQGLNVQTHTQSEIRAFIKNSGASISDSPAYSQKPMTTAPYKAGELSAETQKSALSILNWMRYIAGIDADVKLDDTYSQEAQAGMLLNEINNEINHYPAKPSGMDDSLYQIGFSGASSSNIAWGYPTLGQAIVQGWMNDGDSSNISRVGHRRWILNPDMAKTGFGMVGTHSAVYVFDYSRSSSYSNVAWPAQNMPVEYFNTHFPWSVSTGQREAASSICVKLVRRSDKKTWSFSRSSADGAFYVNNAGCGTPGCIIFRPDNIGTYHDGDIFDVTIPGATSGKISYTVRFFSLDSADKPDTGVDKPDTDTDKPAEKGTILKDTSSGGVYKVTASGASPKVTYTKPVSSKKTSAAIPAVIKVKGITYKVTSIAANAFKNNTAVSKVTIGKNVTSIGSKAFYGCTKLKTVGIGANVKTISDRAFYKCTSLTKITIPSKVTQIGKQAFYGCKKLRTITIKSSKLTSKKVGSNAFKGTYSKASVKVPKEKFDTYKKLLQSKGLSKKATIK